MDIVVLDRINDMWDFLFEKLDLHPPSRPITQEDRDDHCAGDNDGDEGE